MTIDQLLIKRIDNFEVFRLSEFIEIAKNQQDVDIVKTILESALEANVISKLKAGTDILYIPYLDVKNFIKKVDS